MLPEGMQLFDAIKTNQWRLSNYLHNYTSRPALPVSVLDDVMYFWFTKQPLHLFLNWANRKKITNI